MRSIGHCNVDCQPVRGFMKTLVCWIAPHSFFTAQTIGDLFKKNGYCFEVFKSAMLAQGQLPKFWRLLRRWLQLVVSISSWRLNNLPLQYLVVARKFDGRLTECAF